MSLSRKRRKELRKLGKLANKLVHEQREVFESAGTVLSEAGVQARKLGDEYVRPQVTRMYERAEPRLRSGVQLARSFGKSLRNTASPLASQAISRAVTALEATDNKKASRKLQAYGEKCGLLKKKRRCRGVFGIILGALAAVAVTYSLWQALRDDDELWVAPAEED